MSSTKNIKESNAIDTVCNCRKDNDELNDEIKVALEQIDAIQDTYYHIGYTTRDIIRELEVLCKVGNEDWVRKKFPELYMQATFDEQDENSDMVIVCARKFRTCKGCNGRDCQEYTQLWNYLHDFLIEKRDALMNTYYDGKNFTAREIIEKLNVVRDKEWVRKYFDNTHREAGEDSEDSEDSENEK
jgi:hypothetical protein